MRKFFFVAVPAIVVWAGCSTLNTTAVQCLSEQECLAKGPEFANTTCDPMTKTCVPVAAANPGCTVNSDCIKQNNGQPSICRSDNTCIALKSPECPNVIDTTGALTLDNNFDDSPTADATIVLGHIGCGSTGFGPCIQWENTLELVQNQFMMTTQGVTVGGKARPVVWLDCQEYDTGPNGLTNIATHLTQEVQVPLIAGIYDDTHASEIMPKLTQAGAFVVNSDVVEEPLASLPGNPLAPEPNFWRVGGDDSPYVTVVAAAVSDGGPLQQRYIAQGNPDPAKSGGWKILVLQEQSLAGQYWYKEFMDHLTLNGVSGFNALSTDKRIMVVNAGVPLDPEITPDPVTIGANEVAAAVAFKPNIVFYASEDPIAVEYVVNPMEEAWPANTPLPFHLSLCSGWTFTLPPTSLLNRVFIGGLDIPPSPTPTAQVTRFNEYYQQYNEYFGFAKGSPEDISLSAFYIYYSVYDSFYMSELLLSGLGDRPITPANIGQVALQLAASGSPIDDSPESIQSAMAALGAGTPVTINGLSGALNFSATKGAAEFDGNLQCVVNTPFGPNTQGSGFKVAANTLKAQGEYSTAVNPATGAPCP